MVFAVLNASESRSLRRREGIFVANVLNEQQNTFAGSDDDPYSSFYTLQRVSSSSPAGSLSGKQSLGMLGSMSRALSALSAKTSAIFQRKRIPDFTKGDNDMAVIRTELPKIIITPADNVLYSSEVSESFVCSRTPTTTFAVQLVSEEISKDTESLGSVKMAHSCGSSSYEGHSSTTSSTPSSGPSTPSQCSQDLPCSMDDNEEKGEIEEKSLDTTASTEIDLMLRWENGNSAFVDECRRRHWAPVDDPEDGTASNELTSTVEFVPTYRTVLHVMKQTSSSGST